MQRVRSWYYSRDCYDTKAVISHEPDSLGLIIKLVEKEKPDMMIELGTAYYGMTLLLHECNRKTPLFTFDKYDARLFLSRSAGMMNKDGITYLLRTVFNPTVTFVIADLVERKNEFLIALLNIPGKKFLYCDNGKKDREVDYYAPELKTDDVLGLHDWKTEVKPEKIKSTLSLFNPHPMNQKFKERGLLSRFFIKK